MSAVRVKLCGMSREADIEALNRIRPDMVGFVVEFKRSRRSVTRERLGELSSLVAPGIERVGVFVDAEPALVAELAASGVIDWAQLHGSEDETYLRRLRDLSDVRLIQAFRVRSVTDVRRAELSSADLVLLDAGQGSGRRFDWELARMVGRPYLLAGGLGPANVAEAIGALNPWGVDMSSLIERDGHKDPYLMEAALAAVREQGAHEARG